MTLNTGNMEHDWSSRSNEQIQNKTESKNTILEAGLKVDCSIVQSQEAPGVDQEGK